MKCYFRENIRRYEKMIRMGLADWVEWCYGGIDLHGFSFREFLELALPKLSFSTPNPAALELGTGVGPGAVLLAERGFQVTGYDLIREAIQAAKVLANARSLSIRYEVVDVMQIPHTGSQFDLVVDSYCINHIVFDEERRKVFDSVKARLKSEGFYEHVWCVWGSEAWRTHIVSREVERVAWPAHCWHAHVSGGGDYMVCDSNERFYRGCHSSVYFLNRHTGKHGRSSAIPR